MCKMAGISRIVFVLVMATAGHVIGQTPLCVDKQKDAENAFELTCAEGVITYVDLVTGTGTCDKYVCAGETPRFIQETSNCYRQKTCTVSLSDEIIVRTKDVTCYGNIPGFLRLNGYRCFKEDKIRNKTGMSEICTDNDSESSSSQYTAGIIVSHALYPWMYDTLTQKTCASKENGYERKLYGYTDKPYIFITVQSIDLGEDDTLSICKGTNNCWKPTAPATKKIEMRGASQFVSIKFTVNVMSNGAEGFLICFKYSDKSNIDDACKEVTTAGTLTPTSVSDQPLFIPDFLSTQQVTTAKPEIATCKTALAPCQKGKKGRQCRKLQRKLQRKCNGNNRGKGKRTRKNKKRNKKRNKDGGSTT